ncbi:MAG: non-canonical purine NTP pyrophosphatase [Thermoleophilaceae bacterium]
MPFVLASRNAGKLRELAALLAPRELLALPAELELGPEVGDSFRANALAKARAARTLTGSEALADDSGIEARALDGVPGVRSARYAGERATDEQNLAKLLREVPAGGDTRVAYVCWLAVVWPDGTELLAEGRCGGRLTHEPRGEGGFGYDPAFVPDDVPGQRTMAQLSPPEKDAISHRGRAARALVARLERIEAE